jgi:hypothetical protein
MANIRFFPANGNGQRKFVFLGQQTINGTVIDYRFFSKRANLCPEVALIN